MKSPKLSLRSYDSQDDTLSGQKLITALIIIALLFAILFPVGHIAKKHLSPKKATIALEKTN
jgi:hypothetical protein